MSIEALVDQGVEEVDSRGVPSIPTELLYATGVVGPADTEAQRLLPPSLTGCLVRQLGDLHGIHIHGVLR